MKWKKFYDSISNNPKGVHFNDMVGFLKHLGFISVLSGGVISSLNTKKLGAESIFRIEMVLFPLIR